MHMYMTTSFDHN